MWKGLAIRAKVVVVAVVAYTSDCLMSLNEGLLMRLDERRVRSSSHPLQVHLFFFWVATSYAIWTGTVSKLGRESLNKVIITVEDDIWLRLMGDTLTGGSWRLLEVTTAAAAVVADWRAEGDDPQLKKYGLNRRDCFVNSGLDWFEMSEPGRRTGGALGFPLLLLKKNGLKIVGGGCWACGCCCCCCACWWWWWWCPGDDLISGLGDWDTSEVDRSFRWRFRFAEWRSRERFDGKAALQPSTVHLCISC